MFGLAQAAAGYYVAGRFLEKEGRERLEERRFLGRLVWLHVLILLAVTAGYLATHEHHEWLRYLAAVAAGLTTYAALSSFWFAFPERYERGRKMMTDAELDREERELLSDAEGDYLIGIGKRHVPSMYGTSHVLFTGANGTAKTKLQRLHWQSTLPYIG